jgi:hypothetical protein
LPVSEKCCNFAAFFAYRRKGKLFLGLKIYFGIMKKMLLIVAVALAAMSCGNKCCDKCAEKECCKDSAAVCCQHADSAACCAEAAEAPAEAEAPVEAPAAE